MSEHEFHGGAAGSFASEGCTLCPHDAACSRYASTSTQFCSTCGWHRIDHSSAAGGIGHPPRRLRISKRAAEADDV